MSNKYIYCQVIHKSNCVLFIQDSTIVSYPSLSLSIYPSFVHHSLYKKTHCFSVSLIKHVFFFHLKLLILTFFSMNSKTFALIGMTYGMTQ